MHIDIIKAIKISRSLQNITKTEVAKRTGFSLSAISKLEKGNRKVLSEDKYKKIINVLKMNMRSGPLCFNKGTFVKLLLKEIVLIGMVDYEGLLWILDMYKDKEVEFYVCYSERRRFILNSLLDNLVGEPAAAFILRVPNDDVIIYIKRKYGYFVYLNYFLMNLQKHYGNLRLARARVRDLKFRKVARMDVMNMIRMSVFDDQTCMLGNATHRIA